MKIFCIGNSFSDDAIARLKDVLYCEGVKDSVVGGIYIGGCPLSLHVQNIKTNEAAYEYRKYDGNGFNNYQGITMDYALKDEKWDVITLQQCSPLSGVAESYNEDIDILIEKVFSVRPDARLYWHMTWAYETYCESKAFATTYDCSREKMYKAIISAVKEKIVPDKRFSGIISCGTAIENARAAGMEGLSRDGYHLSLGLGRYIASLTFAGVLTGKCEPCGYNPADCPEIGQNAVKASECVAAAIKNPFGVTLIK